MITITYQVTKSNHMKKSITKLVPKLYGTALNLYAIVSPKKAAEKAFHIFCKVRKGKVLPHQEKFLNEAKDQRLQIAEHTIQTYR